MSKKACKEPDLMMERSKGKKLKYYCKKCGEEVLKEKWVCKPKKLK